jgi:hypothetical protein
MDGRAAAELQLAASTGELCQSPAALPGWIGPRILKQLNGQLNLLLLGTWSQAMHRIR